MLHSQKQPGEQEREREQNHCTQMHRQTSSSLPLLFSSDLRRHVSGSIASDESLLRFSVNGPFVSGHAYAQRNMQNTALDVVSFNYRTRLEILNRQRCIFHTKSSTRTRSDASISTFYWLQIANGRTHSVVATMGKVKQSRDASKIATKRTSCVVSTATEHET